VHLLSIVADDPVAVKAYVNAKDYTFPVLHDARHHASRAYKVTALPSTVIIDREGKIVHDFSGTADIDTLMSHVDKLASK
jgi:peroxiredoxin